MPRRYLYVTKKRPRFKLALRQFKFSAQNGKGEWQRNDILEY